MKSQQRLDAAKYKHNCILLHKATPNTALTTDKLKVKWERGKDRVYLMKKQWLVWAWLESKGVKACWKKDHLLSKC